MSHKRTQWWATFKQFLQEIIQSEQQADLVKIQLTHGDIPITLFNLIDVETKNYLTIKNICDFCLQNGYIIQEKDYLFISNYMGFQNNKLLYQRFQLSLNPKSPYQKIKLIPQKRINQYFVQLIQHLVRSFKKIQIFRKKLKVYQSQIINYFSKNQINPKNNKKNTLTKQILKQFLLYNGIFSRTNFHYIRSYIIGEQNNQIYWQDFFTFDQESQDIKQVEKNSSIKQNKEIYNSLTQIEYPNLQLVLSDIENLQKQYQKKNFKNQNTYSRNTLNQSSTIGKIKRNQQYSNIMNSSYLLSSKRDDNKVGKIYHKINNKQIQKSINIYSKNTKNTFNSLNQHYQNENYKLKLQKSLGLEKDAPFGIKSKIKSIQKKAQIKANLQHYQSTRSFLTHQSYIPKISSPRIYHKKMNMIYSPYQNY